MSTERDFEIEEVRDLEAAWPELEPLLIGILEYHRAWDLRPLRTDWRTRWMTYFASRSDSIFLLAFRQDGRAVGFLNGSVVRDHGIFDQAFGDIDNAFVQEESCAKGVGTALLRNFETWCRGGGAAEVRLHVDAANQLGVQFWTKAGFQTYSFAMKKRLEPSR